MSGQTHTPRTAAGRAVRVPDGPVRQAWEGAGCGWQRRSRDWQRRHRSGWGWVPSSVGQPRWAPERLSRSSSLGTAGQLFAARVRRKSAVGFEFLEAGGLALKHCPTFVAAAAEEEAVLAAQCLDVCLVVVVYSFSVR